MTLLLHQGLEAPVPDERPVVRLASSGVCEAALDRCVVFLLCSQQQKGGGAS